MNVLLKGLSFCFIAYCGITQATSLQQAVDTALQTYPQVQSQEATVNANKALVRQDQGGYYPSIDVGGGIGRETANNPATRADDPNGDGVITLTQRESALDVRQLLFDGGKVGGKVEQSKAEEANSRFQLAQVRELVAFQAAQAYLNVQKAREVAAIEQHNVQAHEDVYDKMQRLLAGGAGLRSDVALAQGRLAAAQSDLQTALAQLKNANESYIQIIGQAVPNDLTMPMEAPSLPISLQAAQSKAAVVNPAIQSVHAEWDKTQGAVHEAKANFQPTFSLDLSGGLRNDLDGVPGSDDFAQAMVFVTYNVLHGGSDQAAVQAAHASALAAEQDIMTTQRQVDNNVAIAWNDLVATQNSIPYLYSHQTDSEKVWVAYTKQFKLGQRTLFDVLNAASEYFDAQSSYVSAKYDVRINQYRLLAAMGELVNTLH